MWLTGRLAPDFKTIADFSRDNGIGIRKVCRRFVVLCRELKLLSQALVVIEGSKFKAVSTRDRNFTEGKVDKSSTPCWACRWAGAFISFTAPAFGSPFSTTMHW